MLTDNGIEAVALENNHVMDHGEEVYLETQQHLTDAGIVWSNAETLAFLRSRVWRLPMLSYQTFDMYDTLFTQVPLDVAEAKAKYPLVIVSFPLGRREGLCPQQQPAENGQNGHRRRRGPGGGPSQPPDQSH